MQRTAAVVGAGMAGLSAAFRMREGGLSVKVFEASASVGGRTESTEKDGFLIDPGAILFSSDYTATHSLIGAAKASHLMKTFKPVLGVARGGSVHELDLNRPAAAFLKSKFLSTSAKARLAAVLPDLLRFWRRCSFLGMADLAPLDQESSRDYAVRLLGQEVHDYLIDPLIRVNRFSTTDNAPAADVIWLLKIFSNPNVVVSLGGMAAPAQAIAAGLDVTLNRTVRGLQRTENGCVLTFDGGTTESFDHVVLAVPPPDALAIAPWISGNRHAFFLRATGIKSVAVSVGLKKLPSTRAMMVMVPSVENPDILGVILEHNKAPDRAPPGKGLVTVHLRDGWVGGVDAQDEASLARAALHAVKPMLGDFESDMEMVHIRHWSYVDYERYKGCYHLLAKMAAERSDPRVKFAGEYISAGVEGAVISGADAAKAILGRASET